VPAPDCDALFVQPGCACFTHRPSACYLGPESTGDVGACTPGVTECLDGHWGLCIGQTLPSDEQCDGIDQDCDGVVDDGVGSPCGGCDPGCLGGVVGSGGAPFAPGAGAGVEVATDGALVLERFSTTTRSLWVANSGEATVSRIDTSTRVEVARYPSGGLDPSRTAVDYDGDAYVANRAPRGRASVAKLAGAEDRCVDRDADGAIATSHGPDEVLATEDEECLLWVAPVGGEDAIARALAVDGNLGLDDASAGDPWVGLYGEARVVRLDPATGEVTRSVDTEDLQPYGAAIAPDGRLWIVDRETGRLASIDTRDAASTATVVEMRLACPYGYGIAAAPDGAVWLGGWACADARRYDPALDRWDFFPTGPSARGVALDDAGRVVVGHTGGFVTRLDPATRAVERVDLADGTSSPLETVGVALDADGAVWAVSRQGGTGGRGIASRVDFETGVAEGLEVGLDPYTYSDMTGHALATVVVREGSLAHVFAGCPDGATHWIAVHAEALYPTGATIAFASRRADDAEDLVDEPFDDLGTAPMDGLPYALAVDDGGVLEVRVTLRAGEGRTTPRLVRLGVEWGCPGPD
jgi:DNA-binding beta-propeller fold protein YncE